MKNFLEVLILIGCLTLVSCGTNTKPNWQGNYISDTYQSPISGASRNLTQSNNVFYSGPTGSPVSNNTSVPGTGLTNFSSVSGTDLFGLSSQTAVSDPQQCANRYKSYPRFSGNFEFAIAELATCLNRAMITQNPNLFQQYQTLQSYAYYSY